MFRGLTVPAVVFVGALAACGTAAESGSGQPSIQASVSPSPTVTILDEKSAGERYMTIVCPANAQLGKLDLAAEGAYVGSTMTPEYRKALRRLAASYKKAARQLVNPEFEWPESVSKTIDRVAEDYYGDSAELTDVAEEDTVTQIDWADLGRSADRIRLRLGLPPTGTGCKKYLS